MRSLKKLIKSILKRFGVLRASANDIVDVIPAWALEQDCKLIESLNLIESATCVRDLPVWREPRKIIFTEISPARFAWMQKFISGVDLVMVNNEQDAIAAIHDADAIVGWCTRAMVLAADQLRWVQLNTAGSEGLLNNIPELAERNILVTNLQRAAGPVIAEHCFAMLLSLCRGLPVYAVAQAKARWQQQAVPFSRLMSLQGKTLLVAGLGGIGTEVARRAKAWDMRVIGLRSGSGPNPEEIERVGRIDDLESFVSEADFVINTLPLTHETKNAFNKKIFSAMKHQAIFANVGRGGTVVTEDLVEALSADHLAGAVLDVTEPEPLPPGHALWKFRNVIITPHIAGIGILTQEREWLIMRENVRRYLAGERLVSIVDIARGY